MRPPEITRAEDTRKWLEFAHKDFEVGKDLLRKGKEYWDYAMFHFQQSVEKALKAFLVWHDQPLKKIHDLGTLGQMCVSIDPTMDKFLQTVDSLSRYAVDARYPGELINDISVQQSKDATFLAHQILAEVVQRLPKEVQKKSLKLSRPTRRPKKK